ncbi:hypothetical protein A1O1_01182 [Capronia coronata CBS 617.96]|uniref:Uncharacterized protein n=1 Tax=Capronia coronata CBS 617.96 TaxID=1182541 RepID=W9Z397_9EURO|nr:uncharacterized protein A1O1_01182 [Capronia coronata CBS 617.96]EXJ96056.1 hypothetical protein A1O1_01182 [Capronia coronata CBS 617.96]
MKPSTRTVPLAALLVASASAQTSTMVNDPLDTSVTTVYYSVCPTALTTTTTLSSTITYCPGPNCHGGGPQITAPPQGPYYGSEILAFTTTGPDGKVSEYHEFLTVYDQICSDGTGMEQATYTITEACPCHMTKNPMTLPEGFTTTSLLQLLALPVPTQQSPRLLAPIQALALVQGPDLAQGQALVLVQALVQAPVQVPALALGLVLARAPALNQALVLDQALALGLVQALVQDRAPVLVRASALALGLVLVLVQAPVQARALAAAQVLKQIQALIRTLVHEVGPVQVQA